MADRDEFYVGYLPKAPKGIARRVALVVGIQLVGSLVAGAAMAWAMRSPGSGVWADGQPETIDGTYLARPYPLVIDDRGHTVLVVDFGKRGAQARAADLGPGNRVAVTGYPIRRDGRSVLELVPGAEALLDRGRATATPPMQEASRVHLRGEIVDPKCFLGAMKPGDGKTHKACAIRCISGGIPPMLACWDQEGRTTYVLLASTEDGPLGEWLLPFVGDAVEVRGDLTSIGDLPVLRIDGSGVARLDEPGIGRSSPMIGTR